MIIVSDVIRLWAERVAVVSGEKTSVLAADGLAILILEVDQLIKDAAETPHIDLGVITLFKKDDLRRPIPSCLHSWRKSSLLFLMFTR